MRGAFVIILFMVLSGCSPYSLVKTGPHDIDGFVVTPTSMWNKVPSIGVEGGGEVWSADGVMLNSIIFYPGIKDGQGLFKDQGENKYPAFNSSMLPNEIMELVESSVAKFYDISTSNAGELKPVTVDGSPGFEFTLSMVGNDNIKRKGYAAGTVKNGSLYLLIYQAPAMHYYDKYIQEVSSFIRTATITSEG